MALQDRIRTFREGLVGGIGWAFGVTLGFLLISGILWFAANRLGALPHIGQTIRDLVQTTEESNFTRTPAIPTIPVEE